MRRLVTGLVVLGLVLALFPFGTRAEEDPRTLEVRIYPVSALTLGRWSHVRERAGFVSPDRVSDEMHPLFGATHHEPHLPVGTIDELLELVGQGVEPPFWEEQPGADLRPVDDDRLLVRATPSVHAKVQGFLDGLMQGAGRTATVELRWVGLAPEQAAGLLAEDGMLLERAQAEALFAGGRAGPAVSACCFSGQLAAVTGGRQVAWVQDADVEVAQEAQTTDPIVTVSNVGFLAQIRPLLAEKTALVGIDAALCEMPDVRTTPTNRNGRLEAPTFRGVDVRPVLRLPYGVWAVAEGRRLEPDGPWWLLLVRVTDHAYATTRGIDATLDFGRPLPYAEGPMTLRAFSLVDLAMPVGHRVSRAAFLWPSNFTPPERPELEDPTPSFAVEHAVELAFVLSGDEEIWEDPATLEARNGLLLARNTPAVLDGLAGHLATLREGTMWTLVTTAEVLEVPAALGATLSDQGVLDETAARRLQEARDAGRARVLDAVRLTNFRTARNTVRAGETITYLQDFEVEIAQAAEIGNPVVQSVFSGVHLDLEAGRSPDGGSVQLNVEFLRSDVERPIRTHSTTQGDVELPRMEVFRVRSGVQVPIGRTALVGAWEEDGRHRLLLLTPRLR